MEQRLAIKPPYFEPAELAAELVALHAASAGDNAALRAALAARIKRLVKDARAAARAALDADVDGRRCARGLSAFTDAMITVLYEFTTCHVFPPGNRSTSERMAVVATGGYGRGLLAPRSDIDLLFLLPWKQTAWGESITEFMLYVLWDAGLKVGHAVRTVEQCVALAKSDMTVRTALLDVRFLLGSRDLFDDLEERYRDDVVRGTDLRAFFEAKLAERDERHERTGQSRYRVEPNIKDGKGGLRDLHTLHWLLKSMQLAGPYEKIEAQDVFSTAERRTFERCEGFLWTVRCQLHFVAGRAEERLSFELQPILAELLGYKQHGGLKRVERFMRHYFLIAREVGQLTLVACAALEMKQLKASPLRSGLLTPLTWQTRTRIRRMTDFRIESNRITVANRDVLRQNPANIIRLFQLAEQLDVPFHPDALRLVRESLKLIDDDLRRDKEANRIFLELLTARTGVERVLRGMNEAGVLGRFIPEFGRVVAMMQFNMYHHHTVDEHLIRSVGLLSQIEAGTLEDDHPLATQIIKDVDMENRRALYVAQFLHDIGKGRKEDHSLVGARIARTLCPRLGLTKAETETVAWLIENHLVMSVFAQSRDLNDPKTVSDFAAIVQSPERLRLLLILTVADIRAVGPGVWNGWKGQLLRNLYHETEPVLAGGHSKLARKERIEAAQERLRHALAGWKDEDIDRLITRFESDYWLRTAPDKQIARAQLCLEAEKKGAEFAFAVTTDAFTAVTELTVLARNAPRLLALFAGACAAAGADIMGAHISTTRDGYALDTFLLKREHAEADEKRRADRIGETMRKLIEGRTSMTALMARKKPLPARLDAFHVEPQCIINNTLSDTLTVIEVAGLDRPGLLYALTSALSDLELDINTAHITTYGERAVDVFYVTDLAGRKLTDERQREVVRNTLLAVLAGPAPAREA
jgi:[protein-PII] uridylyltransferase